MDDRLKTYVELRNTILMASLDAIEAKRLRTSITLNNFVRDVISVWDMGVPNDGTARGRFWNNINHLVTPLRENSGVLEGFPENDKVDCSRDDGYVAECIAIILWKDVADRILNYIVSLVKEQ